MLKSSGTASLYTRQCACNLIGKPTRTHKFNITILQEQITIQKTQKHITSSAQVQEEKKNSEDSRVKQKHTVQII
jgi:hypothetical protein